MRFNQHGSSIVAIIVTMLVFSIFFGIFVTRLNGQLRMNVKMRAKYEADMMKTTVQMLNSPRFACVRNLNSSGFGTTLTDLESKSAAGRIVLLNPDVSAPANSVFLASGSRHLHLDILALRFSTPTQVIPVENVFRADLTIEYRASSEDPKGEVQIPYYFMADAAGTLIGCQSTAYMPDAVLTGVTLEDQICKSSRGGSAFYRGEQQFCDRAP